MVIIPKSAPPKNPVKVTQHGPQKYPAFLGINAKRKQPGA